MAIIKIGKGVKVRKINDDSQVDPIVQKLQMSLRSNRKRWL